MEQKKLLYYDRFERMPRHFNGAPIFHFTFKDVKTGEEVVLGTCYYNEELSKEIGGNYYEYITDITKDYDVLWICTKERISPLAESFEDVQKEYQRMVNDGVNEDILNKQLINYYRIHGIRKVLK